MKVMTAFSSRLPAELATKWELTCEERGVTKQDSLEQAIRMWLGAEPAEPQHDTE